MFREKSMFWKKVLFIAPHTDDVELGCGGTIARFLSEGVDVYISVFSTAEDSLPPGSPKNMLREEFYAAMSIYGIPKEKLRVHTYPVRKLSYYRQEVLEDLVKTKNKIFPDAVFVPSGSDLHQDHQVIYAEGLRAFKQIAILGYELPWNHITFSAQAFISLKAEHVEKKCQALKMYRSQHEIARPYFKKEFLKSLAKVRGVQINSEYAEAFEVVRIKI